MKASFSIALLLSAAFLTACGGSSKSKQTVAEFSLTPYEGRTVNTNSIAGTWVTVGLGQGAGTYDGGSSSFEKAFKNYVVIRENGSGGYEISDCYGGFEALAVNGNSIAFYEYESLDLEASSTGTISNNNQISGSEIGRYTWGESGEYSESYDGTFEGVKISDSVAEFGEITLSDGVTSAYDIYCFSHKSNAWSGSGGSGTLTELEVGGSTNSAQLVKWQGDESWSYIGTYLNRNSTSYDFDTDYGDSVSFSIDEETTSNYVISFEGASDEESVEGAIVIELPQLLLQKVINNFARFAGFLFDISTFIENRASLMSFFIKCISIIISAALLAGCGGSSNNNEGANEFSLESYDARTFSSDSLEGTWVYVREGEITNFLDGGFQISLEYVSKAYFKIQEENGVYLLKSCFGEGTVIEVNGDKVLFDGEEVGTVTNNQLMTFIADYEEPEAEIIIDGDEDYTDTSSQLMEMIKVSNRSTSVGTVSANEAGNGSTRLGVDCFDQVSGIWRYGVGGNPISYEGFYFGLEDSSVIRVEDYFGELDEELNSTLNPNEDEAYSRTSISVYGSQFYSELGHTVNFNVDSQSSHSQIFSFFASNNSADISGNIQIQLPM